MGMLCGAVVGAQRAGQITGQHPGEHAGHRIGHHHAQHAAGPQHSGDLAQHQDGIAHILEHVMGKDQVEGVGRG